VQFLYKCSFYSYSGFVDLVCGLIALAGRLAMNPHTTQHNYHPTLRTVSIPHIISHFILVLYDNGNMNTATKMITLYSPQVDPHYE